MIPKAVCRVTKAKNVLRPVGASYYYLLAFRQDTTKDLPAGTPDSARAQSSVPAGLFQPCLAFNHEKISQPTVSHPLAGRPKMWMLTHSGPPFALFHVARTIDSYP